MRAAAARTRRALHFARLTSIMNNALPSRLPLLKRGHQGNTFDFQIRLLLSRDFPFREIMGADILSTGRH